MSASAPVRVISDVDGVICNFQRAFVNVARNYTGRDFSEEQAASSWDLTKALRLTAAEEEAIYEIVSYPGTAARLDPMPGAIEGVRSLMTMADVFFVTKPLERSPTWEHDRRYWFKKHLGADAADRLIFANHKHVVDGDLFIEDHEKNAKAWLKERLYYHNPMHRRPQAVLYAWPYNKDSDLPRVAGWTQIIYRVRDLYFQDLMKSHG